MIFTHEALKKFLEHVKSIASTPTFSQWKGENAILLRHDVDFDLTRALELSRIEAEVGLHSTFFVMVTAESYNVLSHYHRNVLEEIRKNGHEIGLHFDPTLYAEREEVALREEVKILEQASGAPVRSVSLHNPSVHGRYPLFAGMVNAYDPKLFSNDNYLSDSTMGFRGKDPFSFVEKARHGLVQVLLHPLHYSHRGYGYDEIMPRALLEHADRVHQEFLVNATYRSQLGGGIRDAIKRKLP